MCLILVVFFSDSVRRPEPYASTVIVSVLMQACAEFLPVYLLTGQVEVVTILTCIREVPGSNLDRFTDHSEALSWYFLQSLHICASKIRVLHTSVFVSLCVFVVGNTEFSDLQLVTCVRQFGESIKFVYRRLPSACNSARPPC